MSTEEMMDKKETFAEMGRTYQEKVVQALMQDYMYAEQMQDVIKAKFFELKYLQEIVDGFYEYKNKYRTYPSADVIEIILTKEKEIEPTLAAQVKEFISRVKATPLNGDTGYIQNSSLEFCKKMALKEGLVQAIDKMESGDYDSIRTVIGDALNKGMTRDLGSDYVECFDKRKARQKFESYPTGWPELDKAFNGGWRKKILVTFIAPTGAGKSHFLVNCGAAAAAQGMNVIHFTLELGEEDIGLRYDAYYSGVEINEVTNQPDKVEAALKAAVKGRLQIKEYGPKTATVQMLRAYIQRLIATKNFKPDMIVVDYADLLKGRGGEESRFELAGVYTELRALAKELDLIVVTADQTNRAGLEMEIVTIAQIGEAYGKAQICDVIATISRKMEDKQMNSGRLFLAKSRLGRDGAVFPFTLNTSLVKVNILPVGEDPIARYVNDNEHLRNALGERAKKLMGPKS